MYMVHGPPQRHEADQVCLHCMTGCVVCTEVGSVDWRVSGTTVQHLHLLEEHTLTRTPHSSNTNTETWKNRSIVVQCITCAICMAIPATLSEF